MLGKSVNNKFYAACHDTLLDALYHALDHALYDALYNALDRTLTGTHDAPAVVQLQQDLKNAR